MFCGYFSNETSTVLVEEEMSMVVEGKDTAVDHGHFLGQEVVRGAALNLVPEVALLGHVLAQGHHQVREAGHDLGHLQKVPDHQHLRKKEKRVGMKKTIGNFYVLNFVEIII